jgi:hypothetical protein
MAFIANAAPFAPIVLLAALFGVGHHLFGRA